MSREVELADKNESPPTTFIAFQLDDIRYNGDLTYFLSKTQRLPANNPPTEEDYGRLVESVRAVRPKPRRSRGRRAAPRPAAPTPPAPTPADVPPLRPEPAAAPVAADVAPAATVTAAARPASKNAALLVCGALLAVVVAVVGMFLWFGSRDEPVDNKNRPPNLNVAPNRNATPTPADANRAAPATPAPQTQASPSDSAGVVELTTKLGIGRSFSRVPGLSDVKVEVRGTEVTLGGTVYSQGCRETAVRLASRPGVTAVHDKMASGRSLLPEKSLCSEQ